MADNFRIAYSYNPTTGEYTGTCKARKSPLEDDVFLLPANATCDAPLTAGEHQACCFADGAWTLKSDYRGGVYYDKSTQAKHEIKDLDVSPGTGWTTEEPTDSEAIWNATSGAWELPFAVQKTRKIAEINAYYDGYMSNIKKGYSQGEVDTWDTQRFGAADILAGNTMTDEAKWVVNLAAGRSAAGGVTITAEQLAQKITANVAAASALQLACLGLQQGLYDKVQALADGDTAGLAAIVPTAPTISA